MIRRKDTKVEVGANVQRLFSCPEKIWHAALALGRDYRWNPMGAAYDESEMERIGSTDNVIVAWIEAGRPPLPSRPDWFVRVFAAQDALNLADPTRQTLCKLHNAAFDRYILRVRPDLVVGAALK